MAPIKNVTVFGASGSIGPYIIAALLASKFNVTAINCSGSAAKYPHGVIIKETNYTPASLRDILTSQDAVVSCIARTESETELRIIGAAEAVGVQRFLLSEYGADMHGMAIPEYMSMFEGKKKVLKCLKDRAGVNERFTWTTMGPGPFFDYFLYAIPFISFDISARKAIIYDSGDATWTGTTLASVGKAVINVLLKPVETANREVKTLSLQSTQNEILTELEKQTGSKWEVHRKKTENITQSGREHFGAGRFPEAYGAFFASQIWEDGYGRGVNVTEEESDDILLEVEIERLEDIVNKVLEDSYVLTWDIGRLKFLSWRGRQECRVGEAADVEHKRGA